jgi:hypothetical protein
MKRGLFTVGPLETVRTREPDTGPERRLKRRVLAFLRRNLFDRFGRS